MSFLSVVSHIFIPVFERNILSAADIASEPLIRTMPIAETAPPVAMAAMVSDMESPQSKVGAGFIQTHPVRLFRPPGVPALPGTRGVNLSETSPYMNARLHGVGCDDPAHHCSRYIIL